MCFVSLSTVKGNKTTMMTTRGRTPLIILIIVASLLLSTQAHSDQLIIESFAQGLNGKGMPLGWELKQKSGSPLVTLEKERDAFVLHLGSENSSFGLTKEIEVDVSEYPYLNFRWKVTELPKNGDFRKKETDDQAAKLYSGFGKFKLTAKIVGYL